MIQVRAPLQGRPGLHGSGQAPRSPLFSPGWRLGGSLCNLPGSSVCFITLFCFSPALSHFLSMLPADVLGAVVKFIVSSDCWTPGCDGATKGCLAPRGSARTHAHAASFFTGAGSRFETHCVEEGMGGWWPSRSRVSLSFISYHRGEAGTDLSESSISPSRGQGLTHALKRTHL